MMRLNAPLRVASTSLRRIFSSPIAGFFNILVIGIALSLPAGMYVLLQNAQSLVAKLSGPPQISLFLNMIASQQDISQLHSRLEHQPDIVSIAFISRTDALANLGQGLGDVIAGLDSNPLPDVFIVTPRMTDANSLEQLSNSLRTLPYVEMVQLDSAWANKLQAILEFTRIMVLVLATLLSLALIAITFNTIRLQIMTQRDEIQVAKLIGATNAFIRRPFLFFGLIQGLLGGIAAWLIIYISLALIKAPLMRLSQLYGSDFSLQSLSAGDTLTLLLFSMYLGWLGAWLSVARHLAQSNSR